MKLNPIILEIMGAKVAAVAEEMYFALQRASRSGYVKEAADFATASLATNLIFWAILGILAAEVMSRLDRNKDARPA